MMTIVLANIFLISLKQAFTIVGVCAIPFAIIGLVKFFAQEIPFNEYTEMDESVKCACKTNEDADR